MPKRSIDKKLLIDEAYRIAKQEGLSSLSVRKLASTCGIAVGSVYSYFSTKADLTTAVIERFFSDALFEDCCHVREGERFTAYLRRFHTSLKRAFETYEADWLSEIQRLPYDERAAGKTAQAALFGHMEQGFARVLESDPAVSRERLVGPLHPGRLCPFVLECILASLREKADCETLFALLEQALYACGESREIDTAVSGNPDRTAVRACKEPRESSLENGKEIPCPC